MKKVFSLVLFFFLQFYSSLIFSMEMNRDNMKPMNIASQEYQRAHRNWQQKLEIPRENESLIQQQEPELTCFQKCFTTHTSPLPPFCPRINNRPREYHGGYCGTCAAATGICIALSPALIVASPLIILACIINPCLPTPNQD